jgi:hypothetical protein
MQSNQCHIARLDEPQRGDVGVTSLTSGNRDLYNVLVLQQEDGRLFFYKELPKSVSTGIISVISSMGQERQ